MTECFNSDTFNEIAIINGNVAMRRFLFELFCATRHIQHTVTLQIKLVTR